MPKVKKFSKGTMFFALLVKAGLSIISYLFSNIKSLEKTNEK